MAEEWLEELPLEVCMQHLREQAVGRIAFVVADGPLVFPVNYRLVETTGAAWLAVRTRPGNVIDRAPLQVAFEIDQIDAGRKQGWSVLVRGTLHRIDADAADFRERFDPDPWVLAERDSWLAIAPFAITGRALHASAVDWAFHVRAYL
jgi:nitroimidazol reductase NimA-like FMN-containing flavoprotein (pyridoxamine 5'-phosphate oxidase superfamily)